MSLNYNDLCMDQHMDLVCECTKIAVMFFFLNHMVQELSMKKKKKACIKTAKSMKNMDRPTARKHHI